MKRIMIVGGPGAGKSTLARRLGGKMGLPVFHMDRVHWHENWVHRPKSEKIPMARAIEARSEWVFEGGMSATYYTRLARADTLIWRDLPVSLRLWRVTKRLIKYRGKNRPDLPHGCVERIHSETLKFYRYIWKSRHLARAKIARLAQAPCDGLQIVHLRSARAVRDWENNI